MVTRGRSAQGPYILYKPPPLPLQSPNFQRLGFATPLSLSLCPMILSELLRNSVPCSVKWNGSTCQNGMCMPSSFKDRTSCRRYRCGVYGGSSALKTSRSEVGMCELNVVSISMKGHAKSKNLLVLANTVASDESELFMDEISEKELVQRGLDQFGPDSFGQNLPPSGIVTDKSVLGCNEKEEKELLQKEKDQFDMHFFGQNLPPWGDPMDPQGSDIDTENVVQPPALSNNKVTVNENRALFLEENDEEELSRRMLMLSRSNKVRSALELFRSMEFSGLRPNGHACNSLLACLTRHQLLEEALRVFEFTKANKIATGHTYSLILKAVSVTQGCDAALNMFAEMEASSREKDNFDVIVYNTVTSVCGRVNNWVEAKRVWQSMKESGYHGTQITYSLLVSIFVRCGQNELALDAYNEMVQNGLKPKEDTMHAVIGACAKEGKRNLALNVFLNMLNHGLNPNLVACNALINLLGKTGEIKLAFKVFQIIKSLGYAPDEYTWNALLNGLYRAHQHADALQLFERIKTEQRYQLNEHLYTTALMSCQKLGSWDKAVQLLWQMEASGLSVTTATYNLIIGACEVARKPKAALEVYEHMVYQKCAPDTFTHLSLIRSCIWASLWDEVEEILGLAPDVSLYNAAIKGMCLRGKIESAKKLYVKMCKIGLKPDRKTRALMLRNLQNNSIEKG